MVTEQEARDMTAAQQAFQLKDAQVAQVQQQADLAIALAWFNTLGINIQAATTRTKALDNFNQIKSLLKIETNNFRRVVLSQKLNDANEKYKEIKRNG